MKVISRIFPPEVRLSIFFWLLAWAFPLLGPWAMGWSMGFIFEVVAREFINKPFE